MGGLCQSTEEVMRALVMSQGVPNAAVLLGERALG